MSTIKAVTVPKWGLSMTKGMVVGWHASVGDTVSEDDELLDIETAKITNVALAPGGGTLRRITVEDGQTCPVGALVGVIADPLVSESEIDDFVAGYAERFAQKGGVEAEDQMFAQATVQTGLGPLNVGQRGDGEGDVVLLIHGFASDMRSWAFNVESLSEGRTVLAVDLPGHGESTKKVGDGTIDAMAQALQTALESLGVSKVALIGHSFGAAVALALADRLGAAAEAIVLIAPAGLAGGEVSPEFLEGLLSARRKRELRGYLEMMVANPERITGEMVEDLVRFRRLDGVSEAMQTIRDGIVDGSQFAKIDSVVADRKPLVIVGRHDRIVRLPAEIEGARVHVVEGAGHMPHVEQVDRVNTLIAAALAKGGNG